MKELASHIHRLLQENDCVIVPGFGGFIAHDSPAQWMESEHSFLPPSRIIAFNPLLKINDGLLAQSYMTSYRTSFSEATRRIQRAVKQLVHSLYENGSIYLPEIGELRFNIHHNYEFYPEDDKLISPTLYGLESFEMNTLEEVKQQREALQQLRAKQLEEEERQRKETERLRREAEIQRNQEEWQKQHEEQMRLAAMKRAEEKGILDIIGDTDLEEVVHDDIDEWLDAHPEATTTVQDDSLTTPKYKDGSVTKAKLASDAFDGLIAETASGNPATFSDGADGIPVKALKVGIEPIQNLNGYDHPWAGRSGANVLDPNIKMTEKQ